MDQASGRIDTATFRRSLSLADLVIYGVVFMIPIAPFALYGYVAQIAAGMVPFAYLIGMVAMFFTAYSYKLMSRDFPISGSVYSYAYRVIGERTGFLAGWMLILDYLLCPAVTYVVAANALHQLMPAVPRWLLVVAFLGTGTIVNYVGVQITAKVNKFFLVVQLIVLVAFVATGLNTLYHGAGAGRLTLAPLIQPSAFHIDMVFAAVGLCALSFLGFDAISTLAEETRGDSRVMIGKATMLSLVIAGTLFVVQTWIASDLSRGMTFSSPDSAFYEIAGRAGGRWLQSSTAFVTAIIFGVSCAIVAQASIARLLFAMGRDGALPIVLSRVHPKFGTPYVSLLGVAGISLVISIACLDQLDRLSSCVNFGAMTGFMILHVTTVVHLIIRKRSRAWIRHLACPLFGFGILAYVIYSMNGVALALGAGWAAIGIAYGMALPSLRPRLATP